MILIGIFIILFFVNFIFYFLGALRRF